MWARLTLVLLAAVMVSGYYLVRSSYEARRLFTEVDRSQNEGRKLEADHQRLLAERHAQATNLRVEQVARERLKMRAVSPAITQTVELSGRPASAAAGAQP
jgi:cell division protein FtsL